MSLHIRQTRPPSLGVHGALLWIALICLIMGTRGGFRKRCAPAGLAPHAAEFVSGAPASSANSCKTEARFWADRSAHLFTHASIGFRALLWRQGHSSILTFLARSRPSDCIFRTNETRSPTASGTSCSQSRTCTKRWVRCSDPYITGGLIPVPSYGAGLRSRSAVLATPSAGAYGTLKRLKRESAICERARYIGDWAGR
jgi:hypothetical protein